MVDHPLGAEQPHAHVGVARLHLLQRVERLEQLAEIEPAGQVLHEHEGGEQRQPDQEVAEEGPVVGDVADQHPPCEIGAEHLDDRDPGEGEPRGSVHREERDPDPGAVQAEEHVARGDPPRRAAQPADDQRHEAEEQEHPDRGQAQPGDIEIDRQQQRPEKQDQETRGGHLGPDRLGPGSGFGPDFRRLGGRTARGPDVARPAGRRLRRGGPAAHGRSPCTAHRFVSANHRFAGPSLPPRGGEVMPLGEGVGPARPAPPPSRLHRHCRSGYMAAAVPVERSPPGGAPVFRSR